MKTKPIPSLAKLETTTPDDPLELFYNGIKSREFKEDWIYGFVNYKRLGQNCPILGRW